MTVAKVDLCKFSHDACDGIDCDCRCHGRSAIPARYEALAHALMEAPEPIFAIAAELGDHAGRLDAILNRLSRLEAQVATHGDLCGAR